MITRRQFVKQLGSSAAFVPGVFGIFVPTLCGQILQNNRRVMNPLAAAGGGTCPADGSPSQEVVNDEGVIAFGHETDRYYAGLSTWLDASARVICKLRFKLSLNTGSITGKTYKAAIYTMTGTSLNAVVGAPSTGVTGSDAWSATDVIFTMPDVSLSAATNYAFVVYQDGSADASNFAVIHYDDISALVPGYMAVWNTGLVEDTSVVAGEPDIGIYFKA